MLENDEHLRKVFEKTARYLSGKDIVFCFKHPINKNADGEFYYDGGKFYIEIDPTLNPVHAFLIALHEIAHAKKHATLAQITHTPNRSSATRQTATKEMLAGENIPTWEEQANTQAAEWYAFALAHYKMSPNLPEDKKAIAYLTTLLFYKEN